LHHYPIVIVMAVYTLFFTVMSARSLWGRRGASDV